VYPLQAVLKVQLKEKGSKRGVDENEE